MALSAGGTRGSPRAAVHSGKMGPHPTQGSCTPLCLPLAPQIGFLWVTEQPSLSQGLSDTPTPWNTL